MDDIIPCRITPEIFQEFAWFDLLRQKKRWRAPLFFTTVMAAFSAVCFLASGRVRGAVLLGCVLLGVGIILPLGWMLSFYQSVRAEAKRLKLAQAPIAYTLHLTDQGVGVTKGKEKANFSWGQLYRACFLRRCICLYAAPGKAFLLPIEAETKGERLWEKICRRLPEEKAADYR